MAAIKNIFKQSDWYSLEKCINNATTNWSASLIQDLVYARKPIARTLELRIIDEMNCDAENIYLKALIGIVVNFMYKEMYVKSYKRCDGCVNEEPGQQSHDYVC